MRQVIVAYDGSTASSVALDEGAKQAELQEVPLVILTAWSLPAVSSPYPIELDPAIFEAGPRRSLDEVVEAVQDRHPKLDVAGKLVQDDARSALLAETSADDLLVVGTRGRGGVVGLLLGSVAIHCIRHAPCPVLVVRDPHAA